jgi:subtilisin
MKSKALVIVFLVLVMLLQYASAASTSRYLIKSNDSMLKSKFGILHEFNAGFTVELTSRQVNELKKNNVQIEEIYQYKLLDSQASSSSFAGCSPKSSIPWGVKEINGGSGGKGINVAIIDTGVNKYHNDLKANIKLCVDTSKPGKRVVLGCSDTDGHGTHVAGIVAANGGKGKGIYGVAPQTNLFIIKAGSNNFWSDDVAEGIKYAADKGANIISMSLGSSHKSVVEKEAIDYALSKGVLIIAAAGNSGPDSNSITYPAAYKEVVSVAAIDENENVASFSSRGLNDGDYIKEDREIEFSAPGVNIESTYRNCYATLSGTSMAAPHIAGLAAKLWQGNAQSTRNYLDGLAKLHDLGSPGDDKEAGFGLPVAP